LRVNARRAIEPIGHRSRLKSRRHAVDSRAMKTIQLFSYAVLTRLRGSGRREEGQALIEYALIISLIALVAIVALQTTGTNISGLLNKISGDV
jgi:Flp pilus assembly pilin Flp